MGGGRNPIEEGLKNIETNLGSALGDVGYAIGTGNFNNIGRSIFQLANPYTLVANPDEVTSALGEGTVQRATREGEMQAAQEKKAAEIAAATAKENERLEGIRTAIDQSIMARLRTPGRAQVSGSLLTGPATGGTLLTTRGK